MTEGKSKMAITVDNKPEDASTTPWGNVNLTALRNRLATGLDNNEMGCGPAVRECYAVVDGMNAPSQDWHYPHHIMQSDTLVMSVPGVQAATQRARAQNDTGALAHLRRHAQALVDAGKVEGSVLAQ